jgi:4-hydroxy-tetrahydrodipicolinate synthase
MSQTTFSGSFVALVTPFRNGRVDEAKLRELVEMHVTHGTDGIIPCGTTGESPTLSHDEHKRVVEVVIESARKRVHVIAGTGSNSTAEAIHLTRHAKEAGAAAALVVMPYYNKPTPEGQYRHFKAIHDAVDLPIIIYNIPGRSVVDMSVETMARLANLPNIVGVKDATNDLARPVRTKLAIQKQFCMLSGEDATVMAFLAQSGDGCISVSANVAPRMLSEMHGAWRKGDVKAAMAINERLTPLHEAMFCESSPGPVKYAASLLGHCQADLRLPLCEIADASKQKVQRALASAGLAN